MVRVSMIVLAGMSIFFFAGCAKQAPDAFNYHHSWEEAGRASAQEADIDILQKWYSGLTTEQRVQFDDWVRTYKSFRDLDYPQEDAFFKTNRMIGFPAVPPIDWSGPFLGLDMKYVEEGVRNLRISKARSSESRPST